jgi:hypothetical protein
LLIGAWLPYGGGCKLFSTAGGPGLVRRSDYDCLGSGYYLGHYVIRPIFSPRMPIEEVVPLAIQAIAAAKKTDPNCGGDTQFMVISPGGALSAVIPYDARTSEARIAQFEQLARRLLLDVGNPKIDKAQFEAKLENFIDQCRFIRAIWTDTAGEYFQSLLAKFTGEDQSSPQSTTADL